MRHTLLFAACLLSSLSAARGGEIARESRSQDRVSAKDFGAQGDGITDDTGALQKALNAVCQEGRVNPKLFVPAGTYNTSAPLITGCNTFIEGEGPTASIIFQTVTAFLNNGIIANYSLTIQDLAINTTPLTLDYAMIAVERCGFTPWVPGAGCRGGTAVPSAGETYTFVRFASHGFNFGLDISGTTNADVFASLMVEDSNISTNTAANKISEPINVTNLTQLTVENSTLTGDGHSDHGLYLIAVRGVLIRNNVLQGYQDSTVKILTEGYGAGGTCPVVNTDYTAWTVENNRISGSAAISIAAYTYCNIILPELTIAGNQISNMLDTYSGDGASVYIDAACQSVMQQVTMRGNVFQNVGLGGVILYSAGAAAPCADPRASGTIANFSSTGDKFINWSASFPRTYYALTASGPNLLRASISQLNADGQNNGRAVLNPAIFSFQQVAMTDNIEVHTAISSLGL